MHAGVAVCRILCLLGERDVCPALLPGDARRNVEIYVDAVGAAQIGADAVVGGELGKGAGAAGPLLVVVDFAGVVVVVGVVEADAVGAERTGTEDGVVEHVSMLSP